MKLEHIHRLKLIKSISKRRIIWDFKNRQPLDRVLLMAGWDEVSKEIKLPAYECRKKWKTLRDRYRKELKKIRSGKESQWEYFTPLDFLSERNGKLNESKEKESKTEPEEYLEPDATDMDIEDNKEILCQLTPMEEVESSHSATGSSYSQPGQSSFSQAQDDADEDYHFLMSILPSLRTLPQRRKNIVRTKMLQILCEENV